MKVIAEVSRVVEEGAEGVDLLAGLSDGGVEVG